MGGSWLTCPYPPEPVPAPQPVPVPQNLALLVVGVGAIFSLLFHLGTRERRQLPPNDAHANGQPEPCEETPLLAPARARPLLLWKHWLREPAFYQVWPRAGGCSGQ